ncbi:hypothetical protein [Allosalinactinospora lopnorensis]|uniref:hypothetical protein n=1 Tax=Allosalinactinospora lopnorensis TaxID=1352348 RepID=UPI000AE6A5DA|nr:hypothetical protein [Allosalinactinospora lopnorensis]
MTATPHPDELAALVRRLADRSKLRSEDTLRSDVRQLLLTGGLNLAEHDLDVDLEAPVGDRRRIDVEVGYTVIETKRDLRSSAVLADALVQLQGYVAARSHQSGQRYVGVLTDGVDWRATTCAARSWPRPPASRSNRVPTPLSCWCGWKACWPPARTSCPPPERSPAAWALPAPPTNWTAPPWPPCTSSSSTSPPCR